MRGYRRGAGGPEHGRGKKRGRSSKQRRGTAETKGLTSGAGVTEGEASAAGRWAGAGDGGKRATCSAAERRRELGRRGKEGERAAALGRAGRWGELGRGALGYWLRLVGPRRRSGPNQGRENRPRGLLGQERRGKLGPRGKKRVGLE